MSRTVWKFRFDDPALVIPLSPGARVIFVTMQTPDDAWPTIWVELDTDEPQRDRKFAIIGTGHPVPTGYRHCGSTLDGPYVWHVYEVVA